MKTIEKSNTSVPKKAKMTLRDYYRSLPDAYITAPRKALIKRVAERCEVPLSTARSWLVCSNKPRKNMEYVISVLEQETGVSPEDMWID